MIIPYSRQNKKLMYKFHCILLLYHIRKRAAVGDTGGVMSNGDYNGKSKITKTSADQRPTVNIHGKGSTSQEPQTEAATTPASKDQSTSEVSQLHRVRVFLLHTSFLLLVYYIHLSCFHILQFLNLAFIFLFFLFLWHQR